MAAIRTMHLTRQVATPDVVRLEQRQAVAEGRAPRVLYTYDQADRRVAPKVPLTPQSPSISSNAAWGDVSTYSEVAPNSNVVGDPRDPVSDTAKVKRTGLIFAGILVGTLTLVAIWPD